MAGYEIKALNNFIRAAKNQSQSFIIKEFLSTIIKSNCVSESGSVVIDQHSRKKLVLFNDDNFLFTQGFLEEGKPWTQEFDYYKGMAGRAFRSKDIQIANDVTSHPDFVEEEGDVPIASMVCAPIIFGQKKYPFGVASFHNSTPGRQFSEDEIILIKAYTDTLALMLQNAERCLEAEKNKKVFIVHGHDKLALLELQNLLLTLDVEPVIMKEVPKSGHELLALLEELIAGCRGGFVLLTPDDIGKKKTAPDTDMQPRARQNVIFESGILTGLFRSEKRVCFLVKGALERPSDMNSLLFEEFGNEINKDRIETILRTWGINKC